MGFQPQIPLAGPAGWRFLARTQAAQEAAFQKSPALQREIEDFRERIGSVTSAADLVTDRKLLKVALVAFGLEGEIDKKAFIRKVLESDLADPESFANRLTAPGYKGLAEAFGFGGASGARTGETGFADRIIEAYKTRAFESAVGETSNEIRLAMNFRREMAELSKGEGGSWFTVIGSKPLREVIEKAYGLPSQFGQVDVDRQRAMLMDRTDRLFGVEDLTAFADPANVQKVIDRFLARAQLEAGPSAASAGSAALTLLRGADSGGSQGLYNLLLARG